MGLDFDAIRANAKRFRDQLASLGERHVELVRSPAFNKAHVGHEAFSNDVRRVIAQKMEIERAREKARAPVEAELAAARRQAAEAREQAGKTSKELMSMARDDHGREASLYRRSDAIKAESAAEDSIRELSELVDALGGEL